MYITKIELEDFKSHADSTFEFSRGTTAITGENGAGKTSIIEAIAWALFDSLEYKKEDIVRRSAKKATVRVTFESSLDEREYVVYRDTGTGYYVYDPQIKTRIADKKEEVKRFLWQHLGVEPGTDLESLFNHAIGVPQGTFTAIFLAPAGERKRTFDALLKVEEYRRGADELLKTSRYLDGRISAVRENIARAEGELGRLDNIEAEHKTAAADAGGSEKTLATFAVAVAAGTDAVLRFDTLLQNLDVSKAAFEKLGSEAARVEIYTAQKERDLLAASEAAERISKAATENERHLKALGRLQELERERAERDRSRAELAKVESAAANVLADQTRTKSDLDVALAAHQTAETLKPQISEQEALEKQIEMLRNIVAAARAAAKQAAAFEQKLGELRQRYQAGQTELKDAELKRANAGDFDKLQQRDNEIIRQLAKMRASLERDEKFQAEIIDGFCPILSAKCLNLAEGQTLEGFVESQFTEMRSQISVVEAEHNQVCKELVAARDAEKLLGTLPSLRARVADIEAEGKRLKAEHAAVEAEAAKLAPGESELTHAEAQLSVLDNPKARIKLLEKEAAREFDLRERMTKIESNLERLESDKMAVVEQLEKYLEFDSHWSQFTAERDATAESRRIYLANEGPAALVDERRKKFEDSKAEAARLTKALAEAESRVKRAVTDYDADAHLAARAALLDAERQKAETGATLKAIRRREAELASEIARLTEKRKAMQADFVEKERLEKVSETTAFIRETLKDAAPRIARNYVLHVSVEANQMFREIIGNAEHTLKWNDDYGISLDESGFERPFQSLSGGEQMAAALSIRLALLKQLSDVRIAFFDEPTTNMDAERRERLAEQIGRIKYFEQLFVVSHDDTFEGYLDNEIRLDDRIAGELHGQNI